MSVRPEEVTTTDGSFKVVDIGHSQLPEPDQGQDEEPLLPEPQEPQAPQRLIVLSDATPKPKSVSESCRENAGAICLGVIAFLLLFVVLSAFAFSPSTNETALGKAAAAHDRAELHSHSSEAAKLTPAHVRTVPHTTAPQPHRDKLKPRDVEPIKGIKPTPAPLPSPNASHPPQKRPMDADWTPPPPARSSQYAEIAPDPEELPLLTPSRRKQQVLKIKLANGMGVRIVSDTGLVQSAAAVAVEAGSWQDPKDALGLAHFVEHMLFMGTRTHPTPGAFDEYLAAIGAPMSNAQTGAQKTTYAFAAPHLKFLQALSLFAEFFSEPLFASSGAAKERHAVNQEFEMHKDQDFYRLYFVQKLLASKAHPFHRFSIGTLDTLAAVDHAKLVHWFNTSYSANLMHLSIYTALKCEHVRDQVVASFGPVLDRKLRRPWVKRYMLSLHTQGQIVHLKTLRDLRRLTLLWELPAMFAHARMLRPDRLVGAMLGDEGPGSLLALLLSKQLATELSAGLGGEGRDNPTFEIQLQLTNQGVAQWEGVLKLVFMAIARIKRSGVPEYVFKQLKQQDTNNYQFEWRSSSVFNTAMSTAQEMVEEKLQTYPRVSRVIQNFDPKACRALVQFLVPERLHLLSLGGIPAPAVWNPTPEPWYHAVFALQPIPKMTMFNLQASPVTTRLPLPPPNKHIPGILESTRLKPSRIGSDAPRFPELPHFQRLVDDNHGLVWFHRDENFGDPWIEVSLRLRARRGLVDELGAQATVLADLVVACMTESFRTPAYPFMEAGLSWRASRSEGVDIWLSVSGANPATSEWKALLQLLLQPFGVGDASFVSRESFEAQRQLLQRKFKNELKQGASRSAADKLWSVMSSEKPLMESLLMAVRKVTYEDFKGFVPVLLADLYCEAFVYGQVERDQATEVWEEVKQALWVKGASGVVRGVLAQDDFYHPKVRKLPGKAGPYMLPTAGFSRSNATVLVVDAGPLSCGDEMALEVLYPLISSAFFADLRTKQQLGYLVSTSLASMLGRTMAVFVVESSFNDPADTLSRIEAFIYSTLRDVQSGKLFGDADMKQAVASKLAEYHHPIQDIAAMSNLMRRVVREYNGDSAVMESRVANLEALTRSKVVNAVQKLLGKRNSRRLAVVHTPTMALSQASAARMPSWYSLMRPLQADETGKAHPDSYGSFVPRAPYKCEETYW